MKRFLGTAAALAGMMTAVICRASGPLAVVHRRGRRGRLPYNAEASRLKLIHYLLAGMIAAGVIFSASGQDPAPSGKLFIFSGVLRSMDKQARTVTVEASASAVSQKFIVPTDAEIIVKDKPKGELSDLMIGDGVQVKYTEDDGAPVAHQISILGLKNP